VVVLNACHSGAVGKRAGGLAVATSTAEGRGCAAVVAMAYSVYAVAAAEFHGGLSTSACSPVVSVGQAVYRRGAGRLIRA